MMRRLLLAWLLMGSALPVLAGRDALDAQGAAEPPGLARFPGFHIDNSQQQDFRAFRFVTTQQAFEDPDTGEAREGRYWFTDYVLNDGARQPSALELVRNHENMVKQAGGVLVFRSPVSGGLQQATYRLTHADGGQRWIQLDIHNDGFRYQVHMLEMAAMAQKLDYNATQLRDLLRLGGPVALYGILFDTGKAVIQPQSQPQLDQVVALLRQDGTLKLMIEGHTDNVGSAQANLALSQRRAQAVAQYLVSQGVAPARLRAQGYGDSMPLTDNRTEPGRARNRRVTLARF